MTAEERNAPMGFGYVLAAERLGLEYLASPHVMTELVLGVINRVIMMWNQNLAAGNYAVLNPSQKLELLDVARELTAILAGKNPEYMAIPWFTDPTQLRAALLKEHCDAYGVSREELGPDFDPILCRADDCVFGTYDLLTWHTQDNEQEKIPGELVEYVRHTVSTFVGIPVEMIPEDLVSFQGRLTATRSDAGTAQETKEDDTCG